MKVFRPTSSKLRSSLKRLAKGIPLTSALVRASQSVSAEKLAKQRELPPGQSRLTLKIKNPSPEPKTEAGDRRMQKLWNKALPSLQCSNCAFSAQCPQFRSGYVCAFLPFLHAHKIESAQDVLFYSKQLLEQSIRRSQLAMTMETLSGQQPSLELSEQLAMLFQQLGALHDRMTDNGSMELETTDRTIIGSIFGDLRGLMSDTRAARSNRIEVAEIAEDAPASVQQVPNVAEGLGFGPEVEVDLVRELAVAKDRPLGDTQPHNQEPV